MKILVSFIGVLLSLSVSAQSLDRQVVSTSGGFQKNSTLSLEFTIGEIVVGDFSATSVLLTQGFNQSSDTQNVSVHTLNTKERIKLFPNPASSEINLESSVNVSVVILDYLGKEVVGITSVMSGITTVVSVDHLASGVYFLQVQDENMNVSTIRWIKG